MAGDHHRIQGSGTHLVHAEKRADLTEGTPLGARSACPSNRRTRNVPCSGEDVGDAPHPLPQMRVCFVVEIQRDSDVLAGCPPAVRHARYLS
eukprot:685906-Rhodomonas_salina.4